ncbi:MAG: hypothetical protein LBP24_00595 [Coriobacteriales bacterium]|jgi:hypothetical protein|nr:hypothetical protein [Coriobacteriales bacterium]
MLLTEPFEGTRDLTKRRTTTVLLSVCFAIGLVILGHSLWTEYSEDKAVAELKAGKLAIHDQLWYATLLHMEAAANPDVDATSYKVNIKENPGLYTHVEFVMEHPPFEERTPGTLYFAPSQKGSTKKCLDRLNEVIANDPDIVSGEALKHPLTFEDVVGNYEDVKAVFNHMSAEQLLYFYGILEDLPVVLQAEKG